MKEIIVIYDESSLYYLINFVTIIATPYLSEKIT